LVSDVSKGWQSSGFAPLNFADGAKIGHGDFSFDQLEGYYRAYFVATGYVLPAEEKVEEPKEEEKPVVTPPVVNKGCENCEGNNPANRCDGRGCAGNGKGAPGGDQGGGKGNQNQQ